MVFRWLEGTATALALVFAPTPEARSSETEGIALGNSRSPYELTVANAQGVETIKGIVASVSEGAGKVELHSGELSFTLNGTPMDLRELRLGNQVSLVYRRYGGVPWLLPSGNAGLGGGTGGSGWLEQGRAFMTYVGNVQRIDLALGLVYLDDRVLHGHPAVLGKFEVGDRVTVLYQSFAGADWITPV